MAFPVIFCSDALDVYSVLHPPDPSLRHAEREKAALDLVAGDGVAYPRGVGMAGYARKLHRCILAVTSLTIRMPGLDFGSVSQWWIHAIHFAPDVRFKASAGMTSQK